MLGDNVGVPEGCDLTLCCQVRVAVGEGFHGAPHPAPCPVDR